MQTSLKVALGLMAALSAAACSDYLSGPSVTQDPNNPSTLTTPGPLYVAMQQAQAVQHEGQLARNATEYTQQIAGNSRQQIGFDRYQAQPSDIDPYFSAVYASTINLNGGGGLLDIHKMQQLSRKVGDSLFVGIGKVYEALNMQLAADIWGDVPYREAADSNNRTPKFDPQLQIYQDLEAQLDSAINIYLKASGPTNLGPGTDELVYTGRGATGLATVYTAVAHSLKARIYMHMAEVNPANYALALAEVGPPGINNGGPGISSPADDFLYFHDNTPNGNNIWVQFMSARGDIAPGSAMVNILKRRIAAGIEDTSRMAFYFTSADGGPVAATASNFFGVRPGGATNLQTAPGGDNGNGNGATPPLYSGFNSINNLADFRQPEITWAETQLIGAEAALATGNAGLAQLYLNAVRANRTYGATAGAAVTFPPLTPVPATLQNIMEEKYVTLFLNPEVWNDYKRTCLPALAPAPPAGSTTPGTAPIPGRLPYGLTEINANPNTPTTNSAGQPISSTSRNPNDPNPCPVLNYLNSTPLAN